MTKQQYCNLRCVCSEAKESIPEREAIACIFKLATMKKVDLFRLLPLTVRDVIKLRSPVNFVEALRITERKVGGFHTCMAILRERGQDCQRQKETEKEEFKDMVLQSLRIQGVGDPPLEDPTFKYALQNGCLLPVTVWRFTCAHDRFLRREEAYAIHNQLTAVRNSRLQNINWYVNRAANFLDNLRLRYAVGEFHHVMFANGVLMVGVVTVTESAINSSTPSGI